MAMAHAPERGSMPVRWIISAPDDLIWFIGSVAASYLILGLAHVGVSPFTLLLIWAFIFDGTHFFGTLSRTYFDTEERQLHPRLLWGSLALFGLGPALYFSGCGRLFFTFAGLWAYYHLVKQQYGFMMLYKNKNGDLAPLDNVIDRTFLALALWYPFANFMLNNPQLQLGGFPTSDVLGVIVDWMLWWGLLGVSLAFVGRQFQKLWRGGSLNWPKLLLLAAAIPMHWTVFALVRRDIFGYILATPALTIFHNIQYHRLIWFHNRNKYKADDAVQRYGWATVISRRFTVYAAVALAFTLIYQVPRYLLFPSDGWLASFFWGYTFIHYFLDGRIWRVRHDPGLSASLRMARSYAT